MIETSDIFPMATLDLEIQILCLQDTMSSMILTLTLEHMSTCLMEIQVKMSIMLRVVMECQFMNLQSPLISRLSQKIHNSSQRLNLNKPKEEMARQRLNLNSSLKGTKRRKKIPRRTKNRAAITIMTHQ